MNLQSLPEQLRITPQAAFGNDLTAGCDFVTSWSPTNGETCRENLNRINGSFYLAGPERDVLALDVSASENGTNVSR